MKNLAPILICKFSTSSKLTCRLSLAKSSLLPTNTTITSSPRSNLTSLIHLSRLSNDFYWLYHNILLQHENL